MDELSFQEGAGFEKPSRNPKKLIVILFFLILLGIVGFGAYSFLGSQNQSEEKEVIPPTPTEFILPSDTPTPQVSITQEPTKKAQAVRPTAQPTKAQSAVSKGVSVDVQNGSGAPGAAKKAADILTGLGYTLGTTGNADTFDYETTTILVKPSKSNYLDQLKKDLSSSYTIGTAAATLSANASSDALVIVGKQ